MSSIIVVGYRTKASANSAELMPAFKAPSHWKDAAKIEAAVTDKKANFLNNAKNAPYTGTFDSVFFADAGSKKPLRWDASDDTSKPPVSVRVRNYLMKTYPDGWGDKEYDNRNPPFRLVGFNPRCFLKMLGLECSLPSVGKPLPLKMWYSNAEHRDIEEAVLPKDFSDTLDIVSVMKARRPVDPAAREKWDAAMKGWTGPHVDPQKDAVLAVELAAQLGFLV